MITLKNSAHISTSRNIKGFRSCQHATGVSLAHLDVERLASKEERLASREMRRLRLDEQWRKHFERAAVPLRVLPPSARSRETKAG